MMKNARLCYALKKEIWFLENAMVINVRKLFGIFRFLKINVSNVNVVTYCKQYFPRQNVLFKTFHILIIQNMLLTESALIFGINNLLSIENQIGSPIIKFQICDPSCEGIKCFYIWSIIVNHVCFMRVWTLHMTHILPPYYNPSNTSCILWCYT